MELGVRTPPRHIGIIMDGNGRYGELRGQTRTYGHRQGVKTVRRIVEHSRTIGVRYLTLYAFSTENWKRRDNEVNVILRLLRTFAKSEVEAMVRNDINVRFIGSRLRLPKELLLAMERMENETSACTAMTLTVAINYGGRDEIVRAAEALARSGEVFTEKTLAERLDTWYMPDVDLVIRTGGNQRLSNFLLWQSAYAEIHCTDTLWPEFTAEEFDVIIDLFNNIERRFGAVPTAAE